MATNVGAVVLCGGESRRMGRPKAGLPFGPETLLARVVRLVSTVARPVVVVAAADQEVRDLPDSVRVVRDSRSGRGPLQGLADGLSALPPGVEFAYVTAADAPFLEPAWVELLVDRIGGHDLALPNCDGRRHPLAALYRVAPALAAIRGLLDQDQLRVGRLAESLRTRTIDADELRGVDPELRTLRNLNTPDDYVRALEDAGFTGCDGAQNGS
ncbi:molybdenum cofactor guanylyltransferase [Paludisphaera borealis]|uniref:Probable molybdenum cofactor guanylyltransferase n=1 Tax=Paludisphaera borealis TaxID=1387353 RepID=A0A1U7CPB5_9BACT|nr:molybdenum cofactor guanylyltransferase [Paludisphaera borealis]APW60761.1 putative molybdenum cofactor guanylyltransferase [Paludisphaera borealis]